MEHVPGVFPAGSPRAYMSFYNCILRTTRGESWVVMLFLFMDGRKTVGAGLQHFVSTDVVCCCQDPSFCCDRCVSPWQKAVFLQCFSNRLFRLSSPGLLALPYPCSQKADMRLKHCLDELQDLGCGLCLDRWFGVKAYILALFPKDVSASQGSCEVSVPLTP